MRNRKRNYPFLFSVEGQTEKWYLEHLQSLLNESLNAKNASFTVTLNATVQKSPLSYVKTASPGTGVADADGKTRIVHLFDFESPVQQKGMDRTEQFQKTLEEMKEAKSLKNVNYQPGYSNLSFDLWILLHKQDCRGMKTGCKQYLVDLNRAYRADRSDFISMGSYKEEDNFREVLREISLQDVHNAVARAAAIQEDNRKTTVSSLIAAMCFSGRTHPAPFMKEFRNCLIFAKNRDVSFKTHRKTACPKIGTLLLTRSSPPCPPPSSSGGGQGVRFSIKK